jgi:3-deoxy-D-manno-octulosonic-acid transferase
MIRLYNLVLPVLQLLIRIAGLTNPKIRSGLRGRRSLRDSISSYYDGVQGLPRIVIHSSSFGELEQAKPVIRELRKRYPSSHIHVTFFSPSGYENALGKLADVDLITYLPEDTTMAVADFLNIVRPAIFLFARYDVWPNLAKALYKRKIPTIVFSATAAVGSGRTTGFTRSLHREVYRCITRILTVTEADRTAFEELGVDPKKLEVAGDTRFDQVIARRQSVEGSNVLDPALIARLRERHTLVFVAGSTWATDEKALLKTIRLSIERRDNILTIIVPHEPSASHVERLLKLFGVNAIAYSNLARYNREPVIVVDSIGKLFGLYSVADIAMVGGGFGEGVHNVLESAVWGVPAIVGPKHHRSVEVGELIDRTAAFEVRTDREFDFVFWRLAQDTELRERAGAAANRYVEELDGATATVVTDCEKLLGNRS